MSDRTRLTWAEWIAITATPDPAPQAANEPQDSQDPEDDRDRGPEKER